MPPHTSILARLNEHTTDESLAVLQQELDKPELILRQLRRLAFKTSDSKKVFDAWPQGLRTAIESMILDNVARKRPLTMQWAWKPAYDYELALYETPATAVSGGAITLILGSRYPLDEHPVDIGMRPRDYSAPTKLARAFRRAALLRRAKAARARKRR